MFLLFLLLVIFFFFVFLFVVFFLLVFLLLLLLLCLWLWLWLLLLLWLWLRLLLFLFLFFLLFARVLDGLFCGGSFWLVDVFGLYVLCYVVLLNCLLRCVVFCCALLFMVCFVCMFVCLFVWLAACVDWCVCLLCCFVCVMVDCWCCYLCLFAFDLCVCVWGCLSVVYWYLTKDDSAVNGVDYVGEDGILRFANGQLTAKIPVTIKTRGRFQHQKRWLTSPLNKDGTQLKVRPQTNTTR